MVRAMIELMPAIAGETFSRDAEGLALLTGSAALGAVISGLTIIPRKVEQLLYGVMPWWSFGALSSIILTQTRNSVVAMIASISIGISVTRALVSTQIFVQSTTPDVLRGRVLSVHGLIARGSPAIGALIIGFAADQIGLSKAVGITASALLIVFIVLIPFVRSAALRIREITGE